MRACVQRVASAKVTVAGEEVGAIGPGMVVLLGIAAEDTANQLRWMVDKLIGLRIFADAAGKMNCSLKEVGGSMLVVSQFTLLGDCRKGRRPSFVDAAPPEKAKALYEQFIAKLRERGIEVATGRFRAMMEVSLTNDGPVTLIVDAPVPP